MWDNTSPGVVANRAAIGNRLQAARAAQMGGAVPAPHPPMGGPPAGAAPPMGPPPAPMAPGAPPPPAAPLPPSYKAQIAGHLHALGTPIAAHHIHQAIDALHAKGKFTSQQAQALKAHNGPLVGQGGSNTMSTIAAQILSPKL